MKLSTGDTRKTCARARNDYAHHTRRRERFREAASRNLTDRMGSRDGFGKRADMTPARSWLVFPKLHRA